MIFGNKFRDEFGIERVIEERLLYRGDGIMITLDGSGETDRSFDKDPYFKVYNAENISQATKIARISCKSFKQLSHTDRFKNWDLTKKDKKKIANILNNKKSSSKEFSMYNSTWDAMQKAIELETHGKFNSIEDHITFPEI